MMKQFLLKPIFLLLTLPLAVSCLEGSSGSSDRGNIVEVAQGTSDLSTLVTVLSYIDQNGSQNDADDLIPLLADETAELTVFAPSNSAFNKLDQDSDGVFGSSDITILEGALGGSTNLANALYLVVANHAVGAVARSTDLSDGQNITTVAETVTSNSSNFGLTTDLTSGVFIIPSYTPTEAEVTTADVNASNGVVHIIDTVLLDDATAAALGLSAD